MGGWVATAVDGVLRRELSPLSDQRGSFTEVWRESWTSGLGYSFRQANVSRSRAGVLRGLHFHERQADLWVVLQGRAFVAAVDVRGVVRGDAARVFNAQLEMTPGSALLLPPGVAHGFYAVGDLVLLYLVTQEFDASDEFGFAWDDPMAGLSWPVVDPVLSDRDRSNPSLADAIELARQRGSATPPS